MLALGDLLALGEAEGEGEAMNTNNSKPNPPQSEEANDASIIVSFPSFHSVNNRAPGVMCPKSCISMKPAPTVGLVLLASANAPTVIFSGWKKAPSVTLPAVPASPRATFSCWMTFPPNSIANPSNSKSETSMPLCVLPPKSIVSAPAVGAAPSAQ